MMRTANILLALLLLPGPAALAALPLDESPAREGEWGYRPDEAEPPETNPPGFSWRPQDRMVAWRVQCARSEDFQPVVHDWQDIDFNVFTPPETLQAGGWFWRYRGRDADGGWTSWSRVRAFQVPADLPRLPMPPRDQLLGRIPAEHPRLFVRPEDLPRLRELAAGEMREEYQRLVATCERLLRDPPPTAEPLRYPPGMERKSEAWRELWWGNRESTRRALDAAATLGFTRLLGGREEFGQLARRILMDCAEWDPQGATGYRYNDEAGMPYAYYFSRTYTFIHDLLSEAEREKCREVMRVRGDEMYRHLCPRHLWRPYSSHSNRAWHFLGEVAIAFHGEIEAADDWAWFAMNVFYNVYPVWSDSDGGWHEGVSYWSSYIRRFTWWADVMGAAFGVTAYDKPYFKRVGYYPLYLMPPHKQGGGFGDLTARRTASQNVPLVSVLAAQASNPHWQWYVAAQGGPRETEGYVGFVRGTLPEVQAVPPTELPDSRCFHGTGQACLNTSLRDAREGVQVVFKSSPFGTQSHGYEANNSFLLGAYGQRLLIRSGYRDIYGSPHHVRWMWSTRSVNNITVNGQGQLPHSAASQGRITRFVGTPTVDLVAGEAGEAYRDAVPRDHPSRQLDRFTRTLVFVKPELLLVYDRLVARQPSTFEYRLHATEPFRVDGQRQIRLNVDDVGCEIDFLAPQELQFSQTDQYDPNPRERIKLREWHLTGTTGRRSMNTEFVTLYRPYRDQQKPPSGAELQPVPGGYVLQAELSDGSVLALLPAGDQRTVAHDGLRTTGVVAVRRTDAAGSVVQQLPE